VGFKIFTKINGIYVEKNTCIYSVNRKKGGVDGGTQGTSKSFELLQVQ
jgi:hypothetical protein